MKDNCTIKNMQGKETEDEKSLDYKLNFTGVFTIWEIEVKEDSKITADIYSVLDNEYIKVVLVNSKKEVINLSEGNFNEKVDVNLSRGKNYIKLVSKGSKGRLKMSISEDDSISFKRIDLEH
ncbi:hypothetical protein [Miniphocaeibacter massiliensis]|uniref:hypothetical protein n=1 Tax=Miniphocaeibacter massiliensis TaxID=2041841 RepID=UPI000C074919|nr:hypothetical protein [Miniphocaeibacter massiliensis]